jgi:hypothetical protein
MIPEEVITFDDVEDEYGRDVAELLLEIGRHHHNYFGWPCWNRETLRVLLAELGVPEREREQWGGPQV